MIAGAAWFSEIGTRSSNEDSCAYWWAGGVFFAAVADGLGGMPGGEEASRAVVAWLRRRAAPARASADGLAELLVESHRELQRLQRRDAGHASMATTLTVASVRDGELAVAHCGDTRCYLVARDAASQVTEDHSEAQRLFKAGLLTADELAKYPRKHILESALGIPGEPTVQRLERRVDEGDWLVLASDGAYNRLEPGDLSAIGKAAHGAEAFADECRNLIEARGPQDNYTMIVARAGEARSLAARTRRLFGACRGGGNVAGR